MKWLVKGLYWGFKVLKYLFFTVMFSLFVTIGFTVIDPYISAHGLAAFWISIGWVMTAFTIAFALIFAFVYIYMSVEEKYEEIQVEEKKEKE